MSEVIAVNHAPDRTWLAVPPSECRLWLSALSMPWWVAAATLGIVAIASCCTVCRASEGSPPIAIAAPPPGTTFRDCPDCPEMIVIPGGSFTMGSPSSEKGRDDNGDNEGPQHLVRVQRPFAIGVYDITRAEYTTFVRETDGGSAQACISFEGDLENRNPRSWSNPGFTQTDRDPVLCVSWADAQLYIRWLNTRVHQRNPSAGVAHPYRLMTEAEWEYAARAGTTTPYYWGGEATHEKANYGRDDCCGPYTEGSDRWKFTSPVGSFAPNAFGLYDMAGNAWQWTQDCYHESYSGAPSDGSSWISGECRYRVLRGGAWDGHPPSFRSARRGWHVPVSGTVHSGFRVAKTL
jgi:formylglycine-generating enzyme required for sulfatase activity